MRVRRVPHTTAYADTTVRPGPGALPRPPHPRHRRPRRCPPATLPATALAAADRSYGQTEPAAGGDDRGYGQDKSAGTGEDDRRSGPGAIPLSALTLSALARLASERRPAARCRFSYLPRPYD